METNIPEDGGGLRLSWWGECCEAGCNKSKRHNCCSLVKITLSSTVSSFLSKILLEEVSSTTAPEETLWMTLSVGIFLKFQCEG